MNWQEAVERIQNNDSFGYPSAIEHYQNLKNRMFAQIRMNKNFENYSDGLIGEKVQRQLDNVSEQLKENLFELSANSLEAIQKYVTDQIENKNGGAVIVQLQQDINKLQEQIDNEKQTNSNEIDQLRNQIKALLSSRSQVETILSNALKNYSPSNGNLNTVINFLETFMLNTVKWYVETQGKMFINMNAKTTLMGYYKEVMEKKLVSQALQNMNVANATVNLISSANTINDLEIAFSNPSLDTTVSIDQDISILPPLKESFFAQIKARDLDKVKTGFMKISNQAGLLESFNAQMQASGFNNKSWACGVAFLGQAQNILQSLGRDNVLFVSGGGHYFMDEFIQKFRKQNMYLAFEMGDDKKLTKQVGLQRYVENRNSSKNNFLKRFR